MFVKVSEWDLGNSHNKSNFKRGRPEHERHSQISSAGAEIFKDQTYKKIHPGKSKEI
jgi:hypothetical protein